MHDKETLYAVANMRTVAQNAIRSFFRARGYLEIEASLLTEHPDLDPVLTPFEVDIKTPTQTIPAALITSPEYEMKKLLAHGVEKLFYLGKVFRNGEAYDANHRPEFTMLEWYESGQDYRFGMQQTEDIVRAVADALGVSSGPLLRPWRKVRIEELFLEHLGIARVGELSLEELRNEVRSHGFHDDPTDDWSDLFYRLMLGGIEPKFPKDETIVIYDYPIAQAALSRRCPDGFYAERFEVFAGGLEICNAYTELTDAVEQRKRFELSVADRARLGKRAWTIDEELLSLLPSLRQPTFGNSIGFDRLLMSLTNSPSISHVLLSP